MMDAGVCSLLTDRGDVCHHVIASLWHDGLQTHTLQARGQLRSLLVQQCRQLLEVTLWGPKQLVFSLKSTSDCLLLKAGMDERSKMGNK